MVKSELVSTNIDTPNNFSARFFEESKRIALCSCPSARKLVPFEIALTKNILPIGITTIKQNHTLTLAVSNLLSNSDYQELRFLVGHEIEQIKFSHSVMRHAIISAYHGSEEAFQELTQQITQSAKSNEADFDNIISKSDNPIVNFVEELILFSLAHQASDIHIIPTNCGTSIKLRVNGQLRDYNHNIGTQVSHSQIVSRLKILSRLDINNSLPQEGEFKFQTTKTFIRVTTIPSVEGEKVTLRLHSSEDCPDLDGLNLTPSILQMINKTIRKQHGLILVSGPTGSGKTTLLYAILKALIDRGLQIATIEDPVERRISKIIQTSVPTDRGLSFSECLKAQLRQDPDVILVGEIRDQSCARVCLEASLTGHLILASIHARDAKGCLTRLESLGIERSLIAQGLDLIIHQNLVPLLCPNCRIKTSTLPAPKDLSLFDAPGCELCEFSGIARRIPLNEGWSLDAAAKKSLHQAQNNIFDLFQFTNNDNYISSKEHLMDLLVNGQISLENYQKFSMD